ncbi:B-cell lymphoma 3 protein homolog [Mastacembelus armatus]|uniref:B-cell lymphoma 3 protein homolog n=1 Tax=Mastacembelus armatus TaxID=205130 RepID=UPI000E4656DF|nr:B-cell lymphoma 3 protein [Mastacembelus armatus]
MPRIMTMNGDHQTVATAPLDLSTNNRERGSAGSRTPDCRGHARDARVTAGSPASPACTGTVSLGIHSSTVRNSPGSQTGAARKRPTDTSPSKLPLRKRPFPLEPDPHSQSPTPSESGDRFSPAEDTDLTFRESVAGRLERAADESRVSVAPVTPVGNRVSVAPETPVGTEDTGLGLDGYHIRFVHHFNYMYSFPPVPEPNPHLAHQTENLLTDIALATHQDEDGDTALHIAVVQGELAIVWKLIHILQWAHRNLDIYNNLRQTPLHLAVITQQPNMVDVLLNAGADPAALDRNGQTALHLCCEYNQHQCLSVVLARYSSSTCLEIKNYEGLTPLHLAVLRGHRDLARMLLDAGADINAMDVKSGQSPLMHAVESSNADMVYFLIENGCDVNSQSYSGNTALHAACGRGQVDTVRLLLKNGADSSLKNYHNDTPVMVATNKKIADVLRGRGSKPIRGQDQHAVSVSPHGNTLIENGSPSPNHSRGCSPSTTPHIPHH